MNTKIRNVVMVVSLDQLSTMIINASVFWFLII